ncbi:hypothetical protein [Halorussus salinus]|uniref:hypothetical protein n=1 Tax=Halorussus salinus TaxID=1364935 RepID=UPI001092E70B|nr:hypothetical protein [Halorussus salinus]
MTHCYNCGHSGTFVLLAQFALAVPDAEEATGTPDARTDASDLESDAMDHSDTSDSPDSDDSTADQRLPSSGDCSLAVQCPTCDSTDVGVAASDLLARYGSSTTS